MQAAIGDENSGGRRAHRIRLLSERIVQARRGNAAAAAIADGLDPLRVAQWKAADFYARIYADPDWRAFPWWRRVLNAIGLRPFLALERQFFVKPRMIFDHLLASQQQAANTIVALKGLLDQQSERIDSLTDRIVALEAILAAGRPIPPRAEPPARGAREAETRNAGRA